MPDENIKKVSSIKRRFDDTPTIVDGTIEEGCELENTAAEGFATLIIDKEGMDEIIASIKDDELPNKLLELLTYINNKVLDYFYSKEVNTRSRVATYSDEAVINDQGMVIGTKLSSLKGKNVALCSEKSIAAYMILEHLYRVGRITRKPSMVLSTMGTEFSPKEPHAFVLMDKDGDAYPTKHMLFDVENPTKIDYGDGSENTLIGLYSLTDEEREAIETGTECTPESLYGVLRPGWQVLSEKRIYGSKKLNKTM